ncbi:MAG: hypothetical protein ACKO3A_02025 [Opitutia bacterium]
MLLLLKSKQEDCATSNFIFDVGVRPRVGGIPLTLVGIDRLFPSLSGGF